MIKIFLNDVENNIKNGSDIVSGKSGTGMVRYFIKPIITDEIKERNRKMMCNNYRKMHGMPMTRRGSVSYKVKYGMIFER